MFQILDQLERIERRIGAIEYRGGRVVKENLDVFDVFSFIRFRVQKDTTNMTKRRGKHSCVFAIKKKDATVEALSTANEISVYWYSYSEKKMKTADVKKNKTEFVKWLTKEDAPIVFQIHDDTFTLGTGHFDSLSRHDPPLVKADQSQYRVNYDSEEALNQYGCIDDDYACRPLNSMDKAVLFDEESIKLTKLIKAREMKKAAAERAAAERTAADAEAEALAVAHMAQVDKALPAWHRTSPLRSV